MSSLGFPSASAAFGVHRDVLEANPSTDGERLSLLEELKRRGRAAVASKAYPDAKALYSKAIEIFPENSSSSSSSSRDKAILYSNRSLCEFQMNQSQNARDDAEMATVLDPTYVKGFWRLGSAHAIRPNETAQALKAYQSALALEPKNVALQKEVQKLEKKLEKEMKEKEERTEDAEKETMLPPPNFKSTTKQSSSISEEKKNSSNTTTTTMDDEEKVFSASDHVRGYKIVGGKKTSYFHHEQSEEEKRLIGDIAPKRIEVSAPSENETSQESKTTSAWNKAGTWEERDVTSWAITTLTEALMKCQYALPTEIGSGMVKISKVTKISDSGGHASYATVRGKKRYIYEFCIGLNWELSLGNDDKASGTMTFPDVDGTCELGEGYDLVEFNVDRDKSTASTQPIVEKFVQHGGLRTVIHECIDDWVRLFRNTY